MGDPFHTEAVQARWWSDTVAMSRGEIPWSAERDFALLMMGALWTLPLAALGLAWLLSSGEWRLPAPLVFAVFPTATILDIDQVAAGSGVEVRFLLPALVALVALAAAGTAALVSAARIGSKETS